MNLIMAEHFAQAWTAASTRPPTKITSDRRIVFADDESLATEEIFRAQQLVVDAAEAEVREEAITYLRDEVSPGLPREAAEALFDYAYAETYNTGEYHLDGPEDGVFWHGLHRAYSDLTNLISRVDEARGV